jgi:hypothetical protein
MLVAMGAYWALFGWKFAAGIVLSIYVHEMGHVWALRQFGIAASAPMFIPFLGASSATGSNNRADQDVAFRQCRIGDARSVGTVSLCLCLSPTLSGALRSLLAAFRVTMPRHGGGGRVGTGDLKDGCVGGREGCCWWGGGVGWDGGEGGVWWGGGGGGGGGGCGLGGVGGVWVGGGVGGGGWEGGWCGGGGWVGVWVGGCGGVGVGGVGGGSGCGCGAWFCDGGVWGTRGGGSILANRAKSYFGGRDQASFNTFSRPVLAKKTTKVGDAIGKKSWRTGIRRQSACAIIPTRRRNHSGLNGFFGSGL